MAEETPAEREERLQKQEERLQKQHSRLMEQPPPKTGGGGRTVGAVGSGLFEFLGEHKVAILVVGGIAVVIVFVMAMNNQNSANNNTANQQGSLAGAGYQDAGTAYALTQLTSQLDSIQQQLDNTGTSQNTPPPIGGPIVAPGPGGIHVNTSPVIPNSFKVWFGRGNQIYYGTSLQNQVHYTVPSGWSLRAGSDGRYWLINGNQQQLLTNNFLYGRSGP